MTLMKKSITAFIACLGATAAAAAGPIQDRIDAGEPIRIGFANEVPWAYPGDENEPLGFANVHTLGVLKAMGYTDIEPVVTEWGGLIPGLKAGRFDIITGGMYIISGRCENIEFSEPMGIFGDAFLVATGNPKALSSYADIKEADAMMVTGAGYNTVEVAKKEGIAETRIMQVPGPTEILAAVRAGRADAGAGTYFTLLGLAEQSGGDLEVTDPSKLPDWTQNWVGIGFRPADGDFLEAFNTAQTKYLGSDEMLKAVAPYKYGKSQLPDPGVTTEWICANR